MNCRPLSNCVLFCFCGCSFVGSGVFWRTLILRCVPSHALLPFSLSDFVAGLPDEMLLCPVQTLSEYVARTSRFVNTPRRLFVSFCSSSRAMSNNGFLTYCERFLCTLEPAPMMLLPLRLVVFAALRHHLLFFMNWSLSSMLKAVSWRSKLSSPLCLQHVQYILEDVCSLGPLSQQAYA